MQVEVSLDDRFRVKGITSTTTIIKDNMQAFMLIFYNGIKLYVETTNGG